jgi:hypothetical protein
MGNGSEKALTLSALARLRVFSHSPFPVPYPPHFLNAVTKVASSISASSSVV